MAAPTVDEVITLFNNLEVNDKQTAAEQINALVAGQLGWVYCYKLPVNVQVRDGQAPLAFLKIGMVENGNSLQLRMQQEMGVFHNVRPNEGLVRPIPLNVFGAANDDVFCQNCAAVGAVCFFLKTANPSDTEKALLASIGNWTSSPNTCPKHALLTSLLGTYPGGIPEDSNRPAALWMDWLFQPVIVFKNATTGLSGAKEWRVAKQAVFENLRAIWALHPLTMSRASVNNCLNGVLGGTRIVGSVCLERSGLGVSERRLVIKVFSAKPTAQESRTGHASASADAIANPW